MTTFLGIDLAWGREAAHRSGRAGRRRPVAPPRSGPHRRGDRGRPRAVPRPGLRGRDRRTPRRHQRHRLAPGGAGAEPRLPQVRGRHPPLQHRQAGVRPGHPRRPGLRAARAARSTETGIEVYPHAATVALFGLDKTLKYKAKPGRDLDSLRAELLRLMGLVEGVVTTGRGLGDAAGRGRGRHPQERAPGGRGPGRRRRLRLRRSGTPTGMARPGHGVRRRRDRHHRHPLAAGCPSRPLVTTRPREAVRTYAEQHPDAGRRGLGRGGAAGLDPRRGRHQLPDHRRPGQERRVLRREGDPDRGRPAAVRRPARATSATSSASG